MDAAPKRQKNSSVRFCERDGTHPPSKVGRACQRCRRHKIRCDLFRPCTLCLRADVECVSDSLRNAQPHAKRRRLDGTQSSGIANNRSTSSFDPIVPEPATVSSRSPSSPQDAADGNTARQEAQPVEGSSNEGDYGEVESTMGITRTIFQLGSQNIDNRITSAIPDGNDPAHGGAQDPDHRQQRPISSIIGYDLPPRRVMDLLLEEYFKSVHWFSLVIYEPLFRKEYEAVADGFSNPSRKGFLMLLTIVLGIAAWYRSQRALAEDPENTEDWGHWSLKLIGCTESRLFELIEQSSLTSVQICVLLGSYGVYHGKPNSSFALLGAAIRIAQALGLHREPPRQWFEVREERKRVWWTIYTWDRFASITYGRPLGINEKDCDVSMPSDVSENPIFGDPGESSPASICYSAYQRELNKLYLIASPMIETIFGIRSSGPLNATARNTHSALITVIHEKLRDWSQCLPSHLVFKFDEDCQLHPDQASKAHRLQALSLQLTYDSIIIVLHRPFLAQHIKRLPKAFYNRLPDFHSASPAADSPQYSLAPDISSSESWWSAAVRTSRVTELPHLAQLATESHLVAFLAINLFNSAIVMAVCALSDPLSDRAQEAKRNITRIYRLQELLARRSKLSMQSNHVLQDVIRVLLHREAEAMLTSVVEPSGLARNGANSSEPPSGAVQRSVEDTLRLPLSIPKDNSDSARLLSMQEIFTAPNVGTADSRLTSQDVLQGVPVAQDTIDSQSNGGLSYSTSLLDGMMSGMYSENDLYWIWGPIIG